MFFETAHGMMKMTASNRVTEYTGLRPSISDNGANAIGPREDVSQDARCEHRRIAHTNTETDNEDGNGEEGHLL